MSEEIEKPKLQIKNEVYQMYLSGYSPKEISLKMDGVTPSMVSDWAHRHKWKEERDEMIREMNSTHNVRIRQWMMSHHLRTQEEHLNLSQALNARVQAKLDEKKPGSDEPAYLSAGHLKDLATAAKASTDIGARAVGLTDRVSPIADEINKGTMIINIGMKAVGPAEVSVESAEAEEGDFNPIIEGVEIPF